MLGGLASLLTWLLYFPLHLLPQISLLASGLCNCPQASGNELVGLASVLFSKKNINVPIGKAFKYRHYGPLFMNVFAVVVVQSLSPVRLFVTPWAAACPSSLSFTISWTLLKLMSIESGIPSNHLILCCLLPLLP